MSVKTPVKFELSYMIIKNYLKHMILVQDIFCLNMQFILLNLYNQILKFHTKLKV